MPSAPRGALPDARASLEARLAVKVMESWLQRRHQTLVPVALNLRSLLDEQRHAVLCMVAAAATHGQATPERLARTRAWLALVGADAAALDTLEAALAQPPALPPLLARVQANGAQVLAYAASVAALDTRPPVNRHFLSYLAARLELSASVVRSVNRRFQR